MIQISKILKKVPIFKMLGKESINFIVDKLKLSAFESGATIFKAGDTGEEMYIIISGKVDIRISSKDSAKEQTVATLGSGDYFGEMALLTGETRSASVVAVEPCEMFMLYKNDFDVILEKYPSISLSMGKIVSKRLSETLKKTSQLSEQTGKLDASKEGPSGLLSEVPLLDLISFCEENSLTGEMTLTHSGKTGEFEFNNGQLTGVKLEALKDDAALDTMLSWAEGNFKIHVKPLTLNQEKVNEDENETKTLLVVNNSLVVRKVIQRAFKGLGYKVSLAPNIEEALSIIEHNEIDMIISDIKLFDGNGIEFITKVRNTNHIPFIFITDDSLKKEFDEQLRKFDKAELTKTHEVSEIVKHVENIL
jgi:CRP-like cAMP-binding protein